MERKVKIKVKGVRTKDGAGVSLVRVLGHETVKEFDPILMLSLIHIWNICRLQIWQKPQISVSGSVFDVSEKYFTARWDVLRRNTENKNQSNRKQAERNMEGDLSLIHI